MSDVGKIHWKRRSPKSLFDIYECLTLMPSCSGDVPGPSCHAVSYIFEQTNIIYEDTMSIIYYMCRHNIMQSL